MNYRRTPATQHIIRHVVHQRDNFRCRYCGGRTSWRVKDKPYSRTVDHLIPRSMGGRFNVVNLVTSCKACNERKLSYTLREANMRLLPIPLPSERIINSLSRKRMGAACVNCGLGSRGSHTKPPYHGGPRQCRVGGTLYLPQAYLDYLMSQDVH